MVNTPHLRFLVAWSELLLPHLWAGLAARVEPWELVLANGIQRFKLESRSIVLLGIFSGRALILRTAHALSHVVRNSINSRWARIPPLLLIVGRTAAALRIGNPRSKLLHHKIIFLQPIWRAKLVLDLDERRVCWTYLRREFLALLALARRTRYWILVQLIKLKGLLLSLPWQEVPIKLFPWGMRVEVFIFKRGHWSFGWKFTWIDGP